MERTLDRLPEFDDRSRNYSINELLEAKPLRSYTWRCLTQLDQGNEGACVGFGWAHELAARPAEVKNVTDFKAKEIYIKARQLDQWPGENYEGTSVLAGIKAIQELHPHAIDEYRWAFGLKDVLLTLGYFGPVVIGVNWYSGMFSTDNKGYIHKKGGLEGGHCVLVREVNMRRKAVRIKNSWGSSWGINGDAFLSFDDLESLLKERGEACIPVKRKNVKI